MASSPVRRYIINNLSDHQKDIIKMVIRKFGLSRQAALRHMYVLITQGKVTATGKTKDRSYTLNSLVDTSFSFQISRSLQEDQIFHEKLAPYLDNIDEGVKEIIEYGFSEVMNNVISHSEGKTCRIKILKNEGSISLKIDDNGVGIFSKLTEHFSLENKRHAILELSKGKLTTDPVHHTGDGLYFISRLFDSFILNSSGLVWKHDFNINEWSILPVKKNRGTSVFLEISNFSNRTLRQVMQDYSSNGGIIFDKTCIPVILAKLESENLFSRSQAGRITKNLDKFKEVCFDFKGVELVSHVFADEIFRVYRQINPHVILDWKNSSSEMEDLFLDILKNGTNQN
ncbi:MAG: hypothetical protein CMG69_04050 [Candidatus Marinimicrobia bacterium]|nr:hypothetical protein [Candidatus Neomarinimicrobiota bacterium]